MPRRRALLVIAMTAALAAFTGAGPAAAAAHAASPASLAVSAPSAPVDALPGHTVHSSLRVLDPGPQPVTVAVAGTKLALGANGHAQFLTGPDPVFGPDITLTPASPFTVPAGGYREVGIAIAVPAALSPGAYLLGFLVTPVVTGAGVRVINQVGALLSLNVLGVVHPDLSVALGGAHGFVLASSATIVVRTVNRATDGTIIYGEVTAHGSPSGPSLDTRIPPQLLPGRLFRDNAVHLHPTLGFGVFHVTARIVFHLTPARTSEIDVHRTVVVCAPWLLVVVIAVLLGAGITVGWRRRARRNIQTLSDAGVTRPRASTGPGPTPTPMR